MRLPVPQYPVRLRQSYRAPRDTGERTFFECADCGWYHESQLQIDCDDDLNRWALGDIPAGDGSDTEILFLDGTVEKVKHIVPGVPDEPKKKTRKRR